MRDAAVRLRYLDEVLEALFPAGEGRFPPGEGPDRIRSGEGHGSVPSSEPRDHFSQSARGGGDRAAGVTARTVLPHRLVPRRVVPRAWWHAALGRRLPTGGASGTIETHLSEVFGRRVRVVVHVRPARRANRKPILEAYDSSGLVAFVKIGDSERARELVRHEGEVLRGLADRALKVVVPPTVLHHGVWRGLEVLALSPLSVPSRPFTSRPFPFRRVPVGLLVSAVREIAALGPRPGRSTDDSPHGDPYADLGRTAAWHGDFTPWNTAAGADGRLLVWDWERFAVGVPVGFDALHRFFHRALRRMPPPVAARACLAQAGRILEPFGTDAAGARRTAAHYLITLAERHRRDGHEPLGSPATWLNPVIDHLECLL
ncbi:hypothetical protein [Microbispora amethystogenes]|uniref:Aminoglycoside phosphotransferase domain-containing protein n=1 Tax=Microbispora amethystogenes TaxID=1427754 RepID=A0ABQ4FK05_9ACTN|nr:hypothetical protein [Microbispora amethystogenes]GIH35136.1 hypothetical protein Mam01_53000 [Microbispora amethystogenes]